MTFFTCAATVALPLSLAFSSGSQQPSQQPSQAQSQQASQPAPPVPQVQERVEVVATRVPETPHDVPAAVEVVSGDELRSRGVTDLIGALTLAAGVDVAPGGDNGPAGAVPEFWGLREFDAFLLVVDDVPWGGAFNPALTTLSLRDVERIEILRGPAPVTFGATSFVGVIHVVHTAAAATRSYAGLRGGSYGSGGAYGDIALPFGGWESRLSVDFDRQGFSDDRTAFRRGHASWRAQRGGGDRRTWFNADLALVNQDPASPHPRQGSSLSSAVPLDANYNPADAFLNDHRFTVSSGYSRPALGGTWSILGSFAHTNQDIFRGFLLDVADTPDNARGIRETIDQNDLYVDSHVVWPATDRIRVVAGGDFLHGMADAKGADFDYTVPLGGAAVSVAEPGDLDIGIEDRREFLGGYALAEWSARPTIKVTAGLRLNVTFEEREGGAEESMAAAGEEPQSRTNVRPSASIGALFSVWERRPEHVRLYANYRDTFKPAAIDFGIGEAEGEEGEGLLEPETSHSLEGGVKGRSAQGRVDWEADVFIMDFDNLVTAANINGVPGLINAGEQRYKGLEAAVQFNLPRNVSGRVTYSFHDARFQDFVQSFDGVPTQLAGNRLEMSARNLASFGVLYAPAEGFLANAEVKYVGSRYLNKRNTALADGFATLTLGGGYRFDRWEIRLDGRNLTDQRDPVAESELGDSQYYRLPARRVDLSAAVRF